jgi:hypothetical protein
VSKVLYVLRIQRNVSKVLYVLKIQRNVSKVLYVLRIQRNASKVLYVLGIQRNVSKVLYVLKIQKKFSSFAVYALIPLSSTALYHIPFQFYMLSDDVSRSTFNTIYHEQQVQIMNLQLCLLYSTHNAHHMSSSMQAHSLSTIKLTLMECVNAKVTSNSIMTMINVTNCMELKTTREATNCAAT